MTFAEAVIVLNKIMCPLMKHQTSTRPQPIFPRWLMCPTETSSHLQSIVRPSPSSTFLRRPPPSNQMRQLPNATTQTLSSFDNHVREAWTTTIPKTTLCTSPNVNCPRSWMSSAREPETPTLLRTTSRWTCSNAAT